MDKTKLNAVNEVYDAAEELLQNIYDAGEYENEETGEIHSDIQALEKALAALHLAFEL